MMEFLDTVRNRERSPTRTTPASCWSCSRSACSDVSRQPTTTRKTDIVQIARAFTGWRLDDSEQAGSSARAHDFNEDFPERGPKVIFKTRGGFGPGGSRPRHASGEGAAEIDAVVDILLAHRHRRQEHGRRVASRAA